MLPGKTSVTFPLSTATFNEYRHVPLSLHNPDLTQDRSYLTEIGEVWGVCGALCKLGSGQENSRPPKQREFNRGNCCFSNEAKQSIALREPLTSQGLKGHHRA